MPLLHRWLMMLFKWLCFLLYLMALSWEDIRRKSIPLLLLISGALAGFLLCAAEYINNETEMLPLAKAHLGGLLLGLFLCFLSRLAKEAIGKGDGLCIISISFWWESGLVFSLLLGGLCCLAVFGLSAGLLGGGIKNRKYPFMPFLGAAGLLLFVLALFRPS